MKIPSELKIAYIFFGGFGVFLINNPWSMMVFLLLNLILFLSIKEKGGKSFRFLVKVRWFLLLIFLMSALTGDSDFILFKISKWSLGVNYEGIIDGGIRAAKVVTMLLITQVVRVTTNQQSFASGLMSFGLGKTASDSINSVIGVVLDEKKTKKKGLNKNNKREKQNSKSQVSAIDTIIGKVGNLPDKIKSKVKSAQEQLDSTSDGIAESSLAITLIRMVKIAPGLPIAPGHKNVLIFPVFIYGIKKSKQKLAGFKIGIVSGVIHFFMGFGKYGPLGIFQFALIGLFFDMGLKLFSRRLTIFPLLILGVLAGLLRFSTEFLLAWILGLPKEFYFLYLPYVIAQMSFGAGSAFVSMKLLDKK